MDLPENIRSFLTLVRDNYTSLSEGVKAKVGEFLGRLPEFLGGGQEPPQVPTTPTIPDTARLLWQLAGRAPSAFVNYVRQYPDASLEPFKEGQPLVNLIEALEGEMPKAQPDQMGGIPKAWLQSSNVYGFKYDPSSKKLFVRFHSKNKDAGPVYQYDGIPSEVFDMIRNGAVSAKTEGRNSYGRWWKGKNPSLGATVSALLKNGPFPYKKLGG